MQGFSKACGERMRYLIVPFKCKKSTYQITACRSGARLPHT